MQDRKLELDDSRRDVILLTGRTGVGKSTMAEILFGDPSALKATADEDYLCMKIENTKLDPGTQELSMFVSNTICPQLFTDPAEPDLAIYDCPGFADTRGTSNEIATGVYLSEIVRHAERVKIVVTVDYDTIKPNGDRSKFTDQILPEILNFVLDKEIYHGGVFLLVTKYANPNENPNAKLEDDEIIEAIAEYLQEAQEAAVDKFRDRKLAINTLFKKSFFLRGNHGVYSNIAFSRTITREGQLSDMEDSTRRNQLRNQLLYNPNFKFKASDLPDRQQFGCPISSKAKLEIRKIVKNLAFEAEQLLRTVGQKIVNKFAESAKDKEQLTSFFDQYVMFVNGLDQLTDEECGLTLEGLQILRQFGRDIRAEVDSEMDQVHKKVEQMQYLSGVDIEESRDTWKDADGKWDDAMFRMAKDLVTESRKAQRDATLEVGQLLGLICRKVINKFVLVETNEPFEAFQAFLNDLHQLTGQDRGLSSKGLDILRRFGENVEVDISSELGQLPTVISCLKYLTGVDTEQSSTTWADVNMKWDHAMDNLKKDIAQLEAQRDYAEAKAQGEVAIARAEADGEAAKAEGELAEARAEAELAEIRAEAARAETEAQRKVLQATAERERAEAKAQAEIAEAKHRAELAEAAMKRNRSEGPTPDWGNLLGGILNIAAVALPYIIEASEAENRAMNRTRSTSTRNRSVNRNRRR